MNGLFTSFEDRAQQMTAMNIMLAAQVGVGKTYQTNFFPGPETLFVDMEAGTLSISKNWTGTTIDIRRIAQKLNLHPWLLCQMIALLVSGPNPAAAASDPYSMQSYNNALALLAPLGVNANSFDGFKYVIWDSLSVASSHAFDYYKMQPESLTASGAVDTRGVYGTVGQELTKFYRVIQHTKGKTTIVNVILEEGKDELGRTTWDFQIVGSMGKKTLPGIFDHCISLVWLPDEEGNYHRAFICQSPNRLGIPGMKSRGADKQFAEVEQFGNPNLYELTKSLIADPVPQANNQNAA